jgi:eukaryotic-like serine/threonine-protein kinase
VTRSPSGQPQDEVVGQIPSAGSDVAKGRVIALLVSNGKNALTSGSRLDVPDVIGLPASKAVARLRDAGLGARVHLVRSSERPGAVVRQTPSGGTNVAADALVRLEVAKARATVRRVDVPDVVGSTLPAARNELRAAGFLVSMVSAPSQEPAGTILEQSPRAGSQLRKGTTVRLTVSSGPAKIDVPDVTGLDEASATAELERAGFHVRLTDESTADPQQDGTVLRQTPQGGSSAEEGTTVTITVARLD